MFGISSNHAKYMDGHDCCRLFFHVQGPLKNKPKKPTCSGMCCPLNLKWRVWYKIGNQQFSLVFSYADQDSQFEMSACLNTTRRTFEAADAAVLVGLGLIVCLFCPHEARLSRPPRSLPASPVEENSAWPPSSPRLAPGSSLTPA